jgi:DNA polymerase III gamma/tau subunit
VNKIMATNLYIRFRPTKLSEVVGQDPAVRQLEKFVKTKVIPHAFLFTGQSGCGKTTLARIMAREAGLRHVHDLEEVNAASSRGIDDARRLVNSSRLSSMGGGIRAYILDECHQLTLESQNSLLKVIEEPPEHVYWFLCTTNPTKVIPTIRNRCAVINLGPVAERDLGVLLQEVAKEEGIALPANVRGEIARAANGSPRQALMLLEQVAGLPEKDQLAIIGTVQADEVAGDLVKALLPFGREPDWKEVEKILRDSDKDPESVRQQAMALARGILLSEKTPPAAKARAYQVIRRLWDPYFDRNTGSAMLAASCYEICFPGKK